MGVKPKKKNSKHKEIYTKQRTFTSRMLKLERRKKKEKEKKTFSLGVWKESEDLAGLRRVRPVPESRDRQPKTTKV